MMRFTRNQELGVWYTIADFSFNGAEIFLEMVISLFKRQNLEKFGKTKY